jgi:hypothetical protein
MRKADLVLALLVVLAVVATVVAGLRGDSWTDERTLKFASHSQELAAQGPSPAGGAGASFNWTLPDNATAANLTVKVIFSGQAVRGGTATVSVRLVLPDGTSPAPITKPMPIGQGATSGDLTLNTEAMWDETPDHLRDTTDAGHSHTWSSPLRVSVTVEAPPGDLPAARYGFTAQVSGTLDVFRAA